MSIELNNVDFIYKHSKGNELTVFNSLSLSIEQRKVTAIVGASGSGKSTLLKLIGGLLMPTDGTITVDNKTAQQCQKMGKYGLVFQTPDLLPWRTLKKNIELPLEFQQKNVDSKHTEKILADVGLEGLSQKYPYQLSGGMQQRAAIARAIINNPEILLLDEPFSQLDELLRFELLLYIQNHAISNNSTIVIITHDISEAVMVSDTIFVLPSSPLQKIEKIDILLDKPRSLDTISQKPFFEHVNRVRDFLKKAKQTAKSA